MARFPVQPDKETRLDADMARLGIRESDLEESFIRSQGKGGQNVNKVSTCVVLVHRPTGITVKCQEARSQALNRFLARRYLIAKIDEKARGAESAERHRIEKIRRQKRKRSKRAKLKMLDAKRAHSEKKSFRRRPTPFDD